MHSVIGDPEATQTKRLLPIAACPLRCHLAEPQCLNWAFSPSSPKAHAEGPRGPGRGRGGGSERRRLPATVLYALQPLPSLPATPTLAPRPPVAACPSSLFFSPHFSSWGSEDQIPPARSPPHELPGLRASARRSRPVHPGRPAGSSTQTLSLELQSRPVRGDGSRMTRAPGRTLPTGLLSPVG